VTVFFLWLLTLFLGIYYKQNNSENNSSDLEIEKEFKIFCQTYDKNYSIIEDYNNRL